MPLGLTDDRSPGGIINAINTTYGKTRSPPARSIRRR